MEEMTRFLAIDYGVKRIGIALCDPLFTFAYPYKTLLNDSSLWKELKDIVAGQSVSRIILGLPIKENGEDTSLSAAVLKFKVQLENKFKVEVILRDERYTSSIAEEMIIKSVAKKSKRREKGLIDRSAAAIILQDYLDEIKSQKL
jgi:putative Holliday junction resolvase